MYAGGSIDMARVLHWTGLGWNCLVWSGVLKACLREESLRQYELQCRQLSGSSRLTSLSYWKLYGCCAKLVLVVVVGGSTPSMVDKCGVALVASELVASRPPTSSL